MKKNKKINNNFFLKGPRGDLTFSVLDKEYTAIPTFFVLSEIEKRLQKSIILVCENYYNNVLSVSDMMLIIWCGSRFNQKNYKNLEEDLSKFCEDLITLGIEKIHSLTGSFISEYFVGNPE